ncbi:hypothetical protein H6P81_009168 [Aristolochia fimbriata]|uniref:Clp R domain-containing protein n=1 Tax=Aristolochia fimbriata TaxID=158543 RepID=A0AAV7EKA6_ARIFI|nr:hypothetical protein H6P81_009168 [Aristolochia fimbriata]
MRAGACTVQQTLTSEAASVLKHSLGLARRRGHAQVTPLHVAATLLSSRVSLLRRACLKSHPHSTSHPLQCRALELCFNVALNRLPTTPGPLLHATHPSLSNALIAALKRAQAHQRRGCIEQQQQQPLLAIKVELEQLIISILDDPSVSRVMREAGFSSTCVKNNLEDSSSSFASSSASLFYTTTSNGGVQLSSSSCLETTHRSELPSSFWQNPLFFPAQKFNTHFVDSSCDSAKEDLKLVMEVLLRKKKKRNTVIVGDCLSTAGNLVSQLMEKVERGDVPEELKSAHFIKFGVSSLSMRFMKRDDVEMKVADLRRKVGTVVSSLGGAIIIYAGDLKWVVEDVPCHHESYNPADHMIAEIGRLISDFSSLINSTKVWLIGIANYQTYMRCQMKTPSLELQWALQPVAVPSGGLGLSLHASSAVDSRTTLSHNNISQLLETKPFAGTPKEEQDKLGCCGECTSNYEKEASGVLKSSSSSLITSKDEKETQIKGSSTALPYWMQQLRPADNHHMNDVLLDLRRKWNRLCQSLHHHARHNGGSTYAQSQPWWTSSTLQFNSNINSPSLVESASKPSSNYNRLSQFTNQGPSSDSPKRTENKDVKITLALGNSHLSDSENEMRGKMGREELSQALLANLLCHSDSIPSIVRALFDDQKLNSKRGTWLLIRGCDWVAKRRLALTMADSVLGSTDRLVEIESKRSSGQSCERTLVEALIKDSNRVILIEDLDYAEPDFVKVLARGYEEGKLMEDPSGREVSLRKAIVILSVGVIGSTTKTGEDEKRGASVIQMKLLSEETRNYCKRKSDWDWDSAMNKSKYPKTGDEGGDLSVSRQSSFNTLDLNVSAEGDDSESDLTQEGPAATHHEFVESMKNSFVMERNPSRSDRIGAVFRSKIVAAAAEAWGDEFEIEEEVVGELVKASAYFLDSFFEKWLKDVFQTSCLTVKNGGKGGIVLRLCLGGKEENVSGFGFLGSSSLPGRIQVVM